MKTEDERSEDDTDYLAAVERGDMVTAQRMVDAAAKAASYDIGPVFHGTRHYFTEFKRSAITDEEEAGFFFTESRDVAALLDYTGTKDGRVVCARLKAGNHYRVGIEQWSYDQGMSPAEAFAAGHDAYVVEGQHDSVTWLVPEPSQIKSIAVVTRDAAGHIIPLSQRFNPQSDSMHF